MSKYIGLAWLVVSMVWFIQSIIESVTDLPYKETMMLGMLALVLSNLERPVNKQ